jgi:hypothetical protein
MNILYFNQIDPCNHSHFPSPLPLINQQLSVCFVMPSSNTDEMYFDIIHSLSSSFPFLSLPSKTFSKILSSSLLSSITQASIQLSPPPDHPRSTMEVAPSPPSPGHSIAFSAHLCSSHLAPKLSCPFTCSLTSLLENNHQENKDLMIYSLNGTRI